MFSIPSPPAFVSSQPLPNVHIAVIYISKLSHISGYVTTDTSIHASK